MYNLTKDRNEIRHLKNEFFRLLTDFSDFWVFTNDKYEMKLDPLYMSYDVKKKVLCYRSTHGVSCCKLNTDKKIEKLVKQAKSSI